MTVSISKDIEVDYVKAGDIKLRFRLRTPNQERVDELAESIEKIGLLSPPVVDNDNFLVVGNHRRLALVQLGYTEIPVIRKDFSKEYSELAEIDENLKVAPLSKIEVAEHIVKREEIYSSLGLKLKRGFNESAEGLISTEDLAREVGLKTARAYVIPLGGGDTRETVRILTEFSHLVRKALSKRLDIKFLPKLTFVEDNSFEYAEKIEKIIKKNKENDKEKKRYN